MSSSAHAGKSVTVLVVHRIFIPPGTRDIPERIQGNLTFCASDVVTATYYDEDEHETRVFRHDEGRWHEAE